MNLNFEVGGPETSQLVTGKDPSSVSSNGQATKFFKHTALENQCPGRSDTGI